MAIGTQLYYSSTNDPATETWLPVGGEPAKIKIKIVDSAIGVPRTMEAYLINTMVGGVHEKEGIYTAYRRVKVVEYGTTKTIFVGRINTSQPTQDDSYGQILIITATDYLQAFLDRKINTDYNSDTANLTGYTRSQIIGYIINGKNADGVVYPSYNVPTNYITTNITASPSTEKIKRQYASSNKTVARAIEELAQEEPWSDRTWSKVWINGTSRTDINTNAYSFLTAGSQYAYWGQTAPFVGVNVTNVSVVGSYGSFTWQYYASDLTWKSLTILQTTTFGTISMERWEVPSDWTQVSVLGTTAYYVRCLASSVSSVSTLKAECAVGVGFNYYVDENGVFQYFRKGSRPVGGPVAAGLTFSLSPNPSLPLTQRQIMANYEFTNQPKEIVTRVYVKGTAADTGNIVSASACNAALETQLNTIKEKWDFISGSGMTTAELTTYAQNRANSLLYSRSSTVERGAVSVVRYPYYTIGGVVTLLRAGDLVRAKCSMTGTDMDYEVIDIEYTEPNVSARINLISPSAGRGSEADDMSNIINRLKDGDDSVIPSARIGDLIAKHITAGDIDAGSITVDIDLASDGEGGGGTLQSANFVHGTSGWQINYDGVAEFQDIYLRGEIYSGKTLSVGGGSFTAGTVTLDSSGVKIKNTAADASTCSFYTYGNVLSGEIYAKFPATGMYLYSYGTIDLEAAKGDISIGTASGSVDFYAPYGDYHFHNDGFTSPPFLILPSAAATATKANGSLFFNSATDAFMGKTAAGWVTLGALSFPAHALDSASHTNSANLTSSLTATSARTGLMRALSNVSGEYFNGTGGWTVPTTVATHYLDDTSIHIGLSDTINLNTSSFTHGLCPKLDGNVAHFLSGMGTWLTPSVGHSPNADWGMASGAGAASGTLFLSGALVSDLTINNGLSIKSAGAFNVQGNGSITVRTTGVGGITYIGDSNITSSSVRIYGGLNADLLIQATGTGRIYMRAAQGMIMPTATTAPTTITTGAMYYNTTDNIMYYRNSTTWVDMSGGGGVAYLPLAGGTMTSPGNINMFAGSVMHGLGAFTLDAITTLNLAAGASQVITIGNSSNTNIIQLQGSRTQIVGPFRLSPYTGRDPTPGAGSLHYRTDLTNGVGNGIIRYYDSSGNWITLAATGSSSISNHSLDSAYHTTPAGVTRTDLLATSARFGLLRNLNMDTTTYLDGSGLFSQPTHFLDSIGYHTALRNNTVFNVSTTAHGFCPALPNPVDTTKFLSGAGTWLVPPGTGGGGGSISVTQLFYNYTGDPYYGTGGRTASTTYTNGTKIRMVTVAGYTSGGSYTTFMRVKTGASTANQIVAVAGNDPGIGAPENIETITFLVPPNYKYMVEFGYGYTSYILTWAEWDLG